MTFLTDDWVAGTVEIAEGAAVAGSFTGSVDVEVGGGPDGKVVARWTFDDGHLVAAGTDADTAIEPVLALTVKYDDARALVSGSADLNALFISGRMKVAGPTGPLLDLIAATKGGSFDAYRARLEEATEG